MLTNMESVIEAQILASGKELVPLPPDAEILSALTKIEPPAIITSAGDNAAMRFAEYFTANIRNPHTRRAYFRNAIAFMRFCEGRGVRHLKLIKPMLVAAYVEQLQQQKRARPSIKQQLATIRMLIDWLVTGQVMAINPAHSVRGPRHVVTRGKTPVLSAEETRSLLDSIRTERVTEIKEDGQAIKAPDVVGSRDRALIGAMFFDRRSHLAPPQAGCGAAPRGAVRHQEAGVCRVLEAKMERIGYHVRPSSASWPDREMGPALG
jgi:hypothetical protein